MEVQAARSSSSGRVFAMRKQVVVQVVEQVVGKIAVQVVGQVIGQLQ